MPPRFAKLPSQPGLNPRAGVAQGTGGAHHVLNGRDVRLRQVRQHIVEPGHRGHDVGPAKCGLCPEEPHLRILHPEIRQLRASTVTAGAAGTERSNGISS